MPSKRVIYFDLLNVSACIAVIALHCNEMVHTWSSGLNWRYALAIEVLFYWAVPVFFMLTGATCMSYRKRYSTSVFLKKRFKKTLIPFIFWNLAIYVYIVLFQGASVLGPRTFINQILENKIESVYWFFFPLFSIYLSLPIISKLQDDMKTIRYALITSFVFSSLAPFTLPELGISWTENTTVFACSSYLSYVLLGYYLANNDIKKETRCCIYLLGIFAMAFRYLFTLYSSNSLGYVDKTYFDYSAFPAYLQAAAVFVFAKYFDSQCLSKFKNVLSKASSCSFGVYLIHKPVLDFLIFQGMGVSTLSITLRTIGVPILYLSCALIVYVLKKIPVVKVIVP